ncbi:hypothetical protein, partial [Burkholderia pseudomallei]|uniref:hypothetical protein n=1 Tax=Burkholderia pseudomallei TaxID=28450 RepID=UPI001955405C
FYDSCAASMRGETGAVPRGTRGRRGRAAHRRPEPLRAIFGRILFCEIPRRAMHAGNSVAEYRLSIMHEIDWGRSIIIETIFQLKNWMVSKRCIGTMIGAPMRK